MMETYDIDKKSLRLLIDSSRKDLKCFFVIRSATSIDKVPAIIYIGLQPGAYTQPHMHPDDQEIIAVKGSQKSFIFDENGKVISTHITKAGDRMLYPKNTFHTCIALEKDSVMKDVYWGIYNPKTYKTLASWAPSESSPSSEKKEFLRKLEGY